MTRPKITHVALRFPKKRKNFVSTVPGSLLGTPASTEGRVVCENPKEIVPIGFSEEEER